MKRILKKCIRIVLDELPLTDKITIMRIYYTSQLLPRIIGKIDIPEDE